MSVTNPNNIPVTPSKYASIFVDVLASNGIDAYSLLEQAGLPLDLKTINSDYVPAQSIKRLLHLGATQLGITRFDDILRITFRQRILPQMLPYFSDYKTLNDALPNIRQIYSTQNPNTAIRFTRDPASSWLCFTSLNYTSKQLIWLEVFSILYIEELVSALTKKQWRATTVKVKADYQTSSIARSILQQGCQLYYGRSETALQIPSNIMATPIRLSASDFDTTISPLIWHSTFTDTVFELLRPYVKEQDLKIEQAAKLLDMSVRSFQRALEKEKTSFIYIKQNLIFSVACELIEDGHAINYIAAQLAYKNASHFSRAFKKVSGLSPSQYKKSIV